MGRKPYHVTLHSPRTLSSPTYLRRQSDLRCLRSIGTNAHWFPRRPPQRHLPPTTLRSLAHPPPPYDHPSLSCRAPLLRPSLRPLLRPCPRIPLHPPPLRLRTLRLGRSRHRAPPQRHHPPR